MGKHGWLARKQNNTKENDFDPGPNTQHTANA